MRIALQIAELGRGQTSPNPLVGAVVVRDGEVVGQGAHLKAGEPHAEVHALRMAAEKARGSTVYVTLEPCSHQGRTPPCADALIQARVARVVVATGDSNPVVHGRGVEKLREAGIDVTVGVLAAAANEQNEAYVTWRRENRPFVVWKCAATLDGYIAAGSGHSMYVTSAESRASVHALRRQYPAIGVGIGTVLADDPRLTVRTPEGTADNQPLRVVFDTRLRISSHARMFSEPGETLLYATEEGQREREQRGAATPAFTHVQTVIVPADRHGHVSLHHALQDLGQRGVHSILVEGGATLVTALLAGHLIDKVVYYIAPKLLAGGVPALHGRQTTHMTEAVAFERVTWTQVGVDMCCNGYPQYPLNETADASASEGV